MFKSYDCCLAEIASFLYGKDKRKWPDQELIKARYPEMLSLLNAEEKDLALGCNMSEEMINLMHLMKDIYFHVESNKANRIEKTKIRSQTEAYEFYKKYIGYKSIEVLHVLYLNTKLSLIKEETLFEGSVDSLHIDMRKLIKSVLLSNASSIIMMHNHPSDDSTPSAEDIQVTLDIQAVLRTLKVKVIDHIIVCKSGTSSLKQLGKIF